MKVVNVSGRRKQSIARASVAKGTGKVRINGIPLSVYEPYYVRLKIQEAVVLAGSLFDTVDVSVTVRGGGLTGQADAIRLAMCRGLVEFTQSEDLKERYLNYDRHMLVADIRRKEMSKPNCRGKARAKRQKSYR